MPLYPPSDSGAGGATSNGNTTLKPAVPTAERFIAVSNSPGNWIAGQTLTRFYVYDTRSNTVTATKWYNESTGALTAFNPTVGVDVEAISSATLTFAQAVIAVGTAVVPAAVPARADRKYLLVKNTGTVPMMLGFDGSSTGASGYELLPGSWWESPSTAVPGAGIAAQASAAGGELFYMEGY